MATIVHSGIRYLRQQSRSIARLHWKGAMVWCGALGLAAFFAVNLIYQIVRKPSELLAPMGTSLSKSPASTWESYQAIFEEHSTSIISSAFLAALAQVESAGNPVARTYWRWQASLSPFEIYRPASSALGMFQITDGFFTEARKYCIRDHTVVTEGPWHDLRSCWFNNLYARTLPSHAAEMTAAYLHRRVDDILAARRIAKATLAQKQKLAAVIHLCGPKRGETFAARGFRVAQGERCGAHSLQRYLTQVESMKQRFARMAEN